MVADPDEIIDLDEAADLDEVEERGMANVTDKRDGGRSILPLIGIGAIVIVGLVVMYQGFKPDAAAPPGLVTPTPAEQFTTGVANREIVPAFNRPARQVPVAQPAPQSVPQGSPVDRAALREQRRLERQRADLERRQAEQTFKTQAERDALELQRQRGAYADEELTKKMLRERRAAPSLVFDASREERE